mmetsp:Transcript_18879/g.52727  ORF Transcript_18879/g.52727 Transcript_18879/m.52727 type:complete len:585 (+) Transcript_18879:74-1828(+)
MKMNSQKNDAVPNRPTHDSYKDGITLASEMGEPPERSRGTAKKVVDNILLGIVVTLALVCLALLTPFLAFCAVLQRVKVGRLRFREPPSKQRIAVIGGGWSGLQCAAELRELGVHQIKCFERNDGLGGTWHPALRYYKLQIHGCLWAMTFKDLPFSTCRDINDGKASGELVQDFLNKVGEYKNLTDYYAFNAEVVEVEQREHSQAKSREAMLVVKNTQTGELRSEGPFDLVVFASMAAKPRIPQLPGREKFKGKIYHSSEFKEEQFNDIVTNRQRAVVVGGNKSACDLALCLQRGGYDNFHWIYRNPYLFWKYEVACHNRSLLNKLRALTNFIGVFLTLVSEPLSWWIFFTTGTAVTAAPHDDTPPPRDWSKFHFGVLCPKQRSDLLSIPKEHISRGNPQAFTKTGIMLSDGTVVDADVVLFGTGYDSGISNLRLTKGGGEHGKQSSSTRIGPETTMLDHFIVSDFPVLANASTLMTTWGTLRGVNVAQMAVYHLCVRPFLSETEARCSAERQLFQSSGETALLFDGKTSSIKAILLIHLDLIKRGHVNLLDSIWHMFEFFVLNHQTPLKMHLPPLRSSIRKYA